MHDYKIKGNSFLTVRCHNRSNGKSYDIGFDEHESDDGFRLIKEVKSMKLEKKCKIMSNTLSLVGLKEKEFKVEKLSQWKGVSMILGASTEESKNNISIMITKSYCGCTGKPVGAITVMNKEGDDIEDNMDLLVEKIVNKLA